MDTVTEIYVPISWQVMKKNQQGASLYSGNDGQVGANWSSRRLSLLAEGLKEGVCPGLRAHCSCGGRRGIRPVVAFSGR